jgi:F-type H+-transporting ATPase subunit alpha
VPVEDIRRFETELLDYLRHHDEGVLAEIRDQRKLTEDVEQRIIGAINKFKEGFTTSEGRLVVNDPAPDAMDEDEVGHESVKVHRPAPVKK